MIDWLGIDHLFELSSTEAIAGFFTPLAIFAVLSQPKDTGDVLLQPPVRREDVSLCRRWDHVVAERSVRGGGPTASFWESSGPNTSRPATGRFCTVVSGMWPATSTTWARGFFPCRLPRYSDTSAIRGPGPTSPSSSPCSPSANVTTMSTAQRSTARKSGQSPSRG